MSDTLHSVLIVDDDVAVTNYFMVFLMQSELFDPVVQNDSRQVIEQLKQDSFDVVMLDLDMPNVTGMEILQQMAAAGLTVPVIILTGASDVDLAVRAMKQGAFDYLTKPVDDVHLLEVLGKAVEMSALNNSMKNLPNVVMPGDLQHQAAFEHLPTKHASMLRLFHRAETLATGNLCVFIWGERGSGKPLLAEGIHHSSARQDGPFVALDCAQHTPDSFSGVLFGQAQNWSGDVDDLPGSLCQAAGGTLFLNNIEYLSPQVQMRLNTALHTGEYYRNNSTEIRHCDVRFIVASTHDLTHPKFQSSFSRDLLYHVMVNNLEVPPLRDRPEDIPVLAEHFLAEENQRSNRKIKGIHPELMAKLCQYYFPGNQQELRRLILEGVAACKGDVLRLNDLSDYNRERVTLCSFGSEFTPRPLDEFIRRQVEETVRYCQGDREEASRLLQITEKKLAEYWKPES
jgi:DNA-binding NtrC family response regulator